MSTNSSAAEYNFRQGWCFLARWQVSWTDPRCWVAFQNPPVCRRRAGHLDRSQAQVQECCFSTKEYPEGTDKGISSENAPLPPPPHTPVRQLTKDGRRGEHYERYVPKMDLKPVFFFHMVLFARYRTMTKINAGPAVEINLASFKNIKYTNWNPSLFTEHILYRYHTQLFLKSACNFLAQDPNSHQNQNKQQIRYLQSTYGFYIHLYVCLEQKRISNI